jgi:molybdopterin synthase catalytic subunit
VLLIDKDLKGRCERDMAEATIELTRDCIDFAELTEQVRSTQAGAVLLFLGTVRELTGGRRTLALDYEAYPEMAQRKLREIADQAIEKWPIVKLALVHRLGRLDLGEVSVAVAVSCPHRAQAFEAGRYVIDTLKEIVPIWKQENWSDGSTEWVDPTQS